MPPESENYYENSAPPADSAATDQAPDEATEHQSDQSTGLLPKSFFDGKELTPGTECKVRIERVLDDEVEISYVPHDQEESESSPDDESAEGEASAPAPAPEDMGNYS